MSASTQYSGPFSSFWMGGFECADHINKFGNRVDLLKASGHLGLLESDYAALKNFGIASVREGIRWSTVEHKPYHYDWTAFHQMIAAGRKAQVQQVWDLCHFGFPDDLSPLHPHFVPRFVSLCVAFAQEFRSLAPDETLLVVPINEISFLSWLGGDACGTVPYCVRQGWEVKYHLCRAFIAGVQAMREMDGNICVIATEPLIHVAACDDACPESAQACATLNALQFQAMDMLTGRICPELCGQDDIVDIAGLNFYYNNQSEHPSGTLLPWAAHDRHPRYQPLHCLLQMAHERYEKPLFIAETSHNGADRGLWLQTISDECSAALRLGLPLLGVCIYPIVDRPDWDFPEQWHRSGLWDEAEVPDPDSPQRILYQPYAHALITAQSELLEAVQSQPGYLQNASSSFKINSLP